MPLWHAAALWHAARRRQQACSPCLAFCYLQVTRELCEAAHGGQVLLSHEGWVRLRQASGGVGLWARAVLVLAGSP